VINHLKSPSHFLPPCHSLKTEEARMQMPFGRHKGQEIASLPQDYLEWIRSNLHLTGPVAEEIDRALGHVPDENRTATCRAALGEILGLLTEKQVMRMYGFAEKLLSWDQQD
jgi:hypothetical protein